MKVVAVIPSRYSSTRFPGKPLAKIAGRTMIEHVYRRVSEAKKIADVFVATDDSRILNEVERFGGKAVMTDPELKCGTERVGAVFFKTGYAGVLNIQGDEPLISPVLIDELAELLFRKEVQVVSAAFRNLSYDDFLSPHHVKLVVDSNKQAKYFSRSPIPYTTCEEFSGFYHHIGIYGYRRQALQFFLGTPETPAEKSEKLEQLRFLENGWDIHMAIGDYQSHGVDIPSDIEKIERILKGL